MSKKLLFSSVCAATMLSSYGAYADNLFLLQMGVFSTQEAAKQEFSALDREHGKLLDGKRYILRQSRSLAGGDATWRVLVGPFNDRRSASRSCAELKEEGADCFVVETARVNVEEFDDAVELASASETVPSEAAESTETTAAASTATPAQTSAAQSDKRSGDISDIMPWNWFDGESSSAPTAASDAAVAEATETEQAAVSAGNSSNININTHSVYAAAQPPKPANLNLGDLFDFGGDDADSEVTAQAAPAATEIAQKAQPVAIPNSPADEPVMAAKLEPVEPVTTPKMLPVELNIAPDKPSIELPQTPEEAIEHAASQRSIAMGVPDEQPQATPITPTQRNAEVEVAEAIPVPLMEASEVPVTVSQSVQPAPRGSMLDVQLPPSGAPSTTSSTMAPPDQPMDSPRIAAPAVAPAQSRMATTTEIKPVIKSVAPAAAVPAPTAPVINAPKTMPLKSYQQQFQHSRLLQVSVFDNDRSAFACLNQVQTSIPASAVLRTRIIKSTIGQAVLRFGPVNDEHLEAEICNVVARCGSELRCRILTETNSRQPLRAVDPDVRGSNRNYRKPVDISPRHARPAAAPAGVQTVPDATVRAVPAVSNQIWVQLGTSSSKADAQSRFDSLKRSHSDILGSHSATINKPEGQSLAGNVYRLRVGPFESRGQAQTLCAKLSARGAGCLVLGH